MSSSRTDDAFLKRFQTKYPNLHKDINSPGTPELFYLIGLICTDGYIRTPHLKGSYYTEIYLHQNDVHLLKDIQDLYGGAVRYRKDNTALWSVTGKTFTDYLRQYVGITEQKTYSLNISGYFTSLKENEKLCFMRGVIDGDGSIKRYKQRFDTFNICSGSKAFIDMLVEYCISKYEIAPKEHTAKNTHYLTYHGRYMLPLLRDIYKVDCPLKMERKYKAFVDINNHYKELQTMKPGTIRYNKCMGTPDTQLDDVIKQLDFIESTYSRKD